MDIEFCTFLQILEKPSRNRPAAGHCTRPRLTWLLQRQQQSKMQSPHPDRGWGQVWPGVPGPFPEKVIESLKQDEKNKNKKTPGQINAKSSLGRVVLR